MDVKRPGEPMMSAFLHAKGKKLGLPVSGTFELTSKCNFNCKMCYIHDNSSDENAGELSVDEWLDIGRQAADAGMVFLLLTGGEPLIKNDFARLYEGLKQLGLVVYINTNGSLLDDETARLFEKYPPARLNISLYGARPETYKALTGRDAFDTVTENIKRMRSHSIDCSLNVCVTPDNAGDLEEMFDFAEKNDLFIKSTSYMFAHVRHDCFCPGENACRFSPAEAAHYRVKCSRLRFSDDEFLKRVQSLSFNNNDDEDDCALTGEGTMMRCRAGSSSFWIDSSGKMSACGMFNVNKFDVRSLGFNRAWEQVRKTTAEIRLPEKCADCAGRELCNICAAVALSETGRFDGLPEYVCEMTELTEKLLVQEAEKIRRIK